MIGNKRFLLKDWLTLFLYNLVLGVVWSVIFYFIFGYKSVDNNDLLVLTGVSFLVALGLIQLANFILFSPNKVSKELLCIVQFLLFAFLWMRNYPVNIYFLVFPFLNYLSCNAVFKQKNKIS